MSLSELEAKSCIACHSLQHLPLQGNHVTVWFLEHVFSLRSLLERPQTTVVPSRCPHHRERSPGVPLSRPLSCDGKNLLARINWLFVLAAWSKTGEFCHFHQWSPITSSQTGTPPGRIYKLSPPPFTLNTGVLRQLHTKSPEILHWVE